MNIFLLARPQMAADFVWQWKKASRVPKMGIHAVTSYKYVRYVNPQTIVPMMRLGPVFPGMSFWQPLGNNMNDLMSSRA
jgi:hypothetical protein